MDLTEHEQRNLNPEWHPVALLVRGWINRITLAPTQSVRVQFGGGPSVYVVVTDRVPDADIPCHKHLAVKAAKFALDELVIVLAKVPIAHAIEALTSYLKPVLREALAELAEHEIEEWAKLDGEPLWDAHAPRSNETNTLGIKR